MNKICLIILTWITFLSTASATGQEGERIIWKGQKYEMLTQGRKVNASFGKGKSTRC